MNIDEFLDSVAAKNANPIPIATTPAGVNAMPSDAVVRNLMKSKFHSASDLEPILVNSVKGVISSEKPSSSTAGFSDNTDSTKSFNSTVSTDNAKNASGATGASGASGLAPLSDMEIAKNTIDQFESLSVALETSLARADYQHAFDTYIALQSSLAQIQDQQKKQQRLFQDRLNTFKTRLFNAVQESTVQFQSVMQELFVQIGQIKNLVDSNQIDTATNQYTAVKQTIDQLPNNFADKKEKLQDELLKVYLYLKGRSEKHTEASFTSISAEMKQLYIIAVAAIKTSNWEQAQQAYEQLAAKYAQLPEGFTEQKVQLFDYVTFLHSQLTLDSAIAAQKESRTQPQMQPRMSFAQSQATTFAQFSDPNVKAVLEQSLNLEQSPKPQVPLVAPVQITPQTQTIIPPQTAPQNQSIPIPEKIKPVTQTDSRAPVSAVQTATLSDTDKLSTPTVSQVAKSAPADLFVNLNKPSVNVLTPAIPKLKVESVPLSPKTVSAPTPVMASVKISTPTSSPGLSSSNKFATIKPTTKNSPVHEKTPPAKKESLIIEKIGNDMSAVQLQERAKKLTQRLEQLKHSLN